MAEIIRPLFDIRVIALIGILALGGVGISMATQKKPIQLPQGKEGKAQAAEQLGGAEENWLDYVLCDTLNYCDKGGHKSRSRANDNGEHNEHWKKQGK